MKRFLLLSFLLIVAQFFLPSPVFAGTCDYPSFCNTSSRTGADPKPHDKCTIPGITTDASGTHDLYGYHYGTSDSCGFFGGSGPCVPRCGFLGTGWCCDPDNPASKPPDTANPIPPPCASNISSKGGCSSVGTPFGIIPTDIGGLTKSIFSILLGFSGAIAVLLVIAAGYQLMMSQGNPEKVKEARERLIAAIVGLIFIFFSVTILQIIGVNILQIPGFGG